MKKKLLIAVGILVAIPILLLAGVALFINPIVRTGVEKGGSAALKVPVQLEKASIRWSGHATLGKFEVGNPGGFSERKAFAFDQIDVDLQPRDLLKSVIEVGQISVVKPEVIVEFSGTKNNLSALLDNLSAGKSEPAPKAAGKKFIVHKVRIQEATVWFKSNLLGGGPRSVTLPSLELENVGTAEGGATLGDILEAVIQALGSAALKSGEGILPKELLDNLRSGIKDVPGQMLDEIRRRAEELKSKTPDPSELEKKIRKWPKPKTAD